MQTALLVNNMAPKYVLIAGTEKDKEVVANLEKENDELKSKLKANDEQHEKEKLEAADSYQEPGPVVKAIIAAMDEDHKEDAKARIAKLIAIAQEEDEEKKAKLIKAQKDIFETGNGTNTNAKSAMDEEKEEEQTAVIAPGSTPASYKVFSVPCVNTSLVSFTTGISNKIQYQSVMAVISVHHLLVIYQV